MPQHVTSLVRTSVKTTNYTAVPGDLIPVDTTGGNVFITLPNAPANGNRVTVKHVVQGGANKVTLQTQGTDTFNRTGGPTTLDLTEVNHSVAAQYDGGVWTLVTDDASALVTALSRALPGPLGRWKYKLATTPQTCKMVKVGDSNSDAATNAAALYRTLYGVHTQQGEALYGLGAADIFTDGAITGGNTLGSNQASFTSDDVGRLVNGQGISGGTVISAYVNATTVTLNQSSTNATGLTFRVGRHIISGGNNGRPLLDWNASPSMAFPSMPYNRDRLVADQPDLIVIEWLTNDTRQGLLGTTVAACVAAGRARLQAFIDFCRANIPGADILLVTPATFLSANVSGLNYVTDASNNVNPAGLAQIYSTALRRIYLSFLGQYPNVDVLDTQAEVFGTRAVSAHPLMQNQLHPTTVGTSDVKSLTALGGGYVAVANAIANKIGFKRNAFPADAGQRTRTDFIVYDAPGAGQIRLLSRDYPNTPASRTPVFPGDTLYVNGLDTPISLTGASIDRITSNDWLVMTGIGSTDFSPYIGNTASITSSHAGSGAGDRVQLFVDLPSVAANSTQTVDIAVTGVYPGQLGKSVGVVAIPGAGFANMTGIWLLAAYPISADTVRLVIQNSTGAAIDMTGESWTFWILR